MILYAVRDMITGLDAVITLAIIAWGTISIFFESNKALQEAMLRPELSQVSQVLVHRKLHSFLGHDASNPPLSSGMIWLPHSQSLLPI